jgi:hypothetical protein
VEKDVTPNYFICVGKMGSFILNEQLAFGSELVSFGSQLPRRRIG